MVCVNDYLCLHWLLVALLHLNIYHHDFNLWFSWVYNKGTIPSEFGEFSLLHYLNLHSNSLEGIVLCCFCSSIVDCYHCFTCYDTGTIPSSLCDIGTLTFLHITDSASNPLLTRSPMCLTTVTDRIIPPNYQESAICGFIAATNIESISTHTMWSCNANGVTSTDPCSPGWSGISCSGSAVDNLGLGNIGLTGLALYTSIMKIFTFYLSFS